MNWGDLWDSLGILKYGLFLPAALGINLLAGDPASFSETMGGTASTVFNLILSLFNFAMASAGFVLWALNLAFADFFLAIMLVELFILIFASYKDSEENTIVYFFTMQFMLVSWLMHFLFTSATRLVDVIRLFKPGG